MLFFFFFLREKFGCVCVYPCVCVCESVCVCENVSVCRDQKRAPNPLALELQVVFSGFSVDAGNQMQILWKNSKSSSPLRYLFYLYQENSFQMPICLWGFPVSCI